MNRENEKNCFFGFDGGSYCFSFSCNKKDYKTVTHDPDLYCKTMHELNYVIIYDIFNPPVASRIFAYSNLAAYEVLAKEAVIMVHFKGN